MADDDVIVTGASNAALAAAVSTHANGASREVALETAPEAKPGGNTYRSNAILRFAFEEGTHS